MRFSILFAILFTFCNWALAVEDCSTFAVDERVQQQVPIFRQSNSGICFASAAATAMDMWRWTQHFHDGGTVETMNYTPASPLLLALRYWSLNNYNTDEGGSPKTAILQSMQLGLPLTHLRVESETFSLEQEEEKFALYLAARPRPAGQSARTKDEILTLLRTELSDFGSTYLSRYSRETQPERFYTFEQADSMSTLREFNFTERGDKTLNKEQLNRMFVQDRVRPQPIVASLCFQVLRNNSYVPPKIISGELDTEVEGSCERHVVIITGRERVGSICKYKIRDSVLGTHIYLTEDDLLRNLYGLVVLTDVVKD